MTVLERYLSKQRNYPDFISDQPEENLLLSVVIPVHNEPDILPTLNALANCESTINGVEVLLIVNASEVAADEIKQQNVLTATVIEDFISTYNGDLKFYCILNNELPKKHAGVGLARKMGMDEAVARFDKINQEKGIIVCFDADCTCAPNYLKEIEHGFLNHSPTAMSIRFQHPLKGDEYSAQIYEYITDYELHLRVYKNAISFSNLPYGYHTVGSSMAVNALDYCKQGGMNKRKAGEDFYFLQKFIQLGPIYELNSTYVFPSPRVSDRVPFGTGRAIGERVESGEVQFLTYSLNSFFDLKKLTSKVASFYDSFDEVEQLPISIISFWGKVALIEKLKEIKRESASEVTFIKRFYAWFDAFQLLKFVHFSRDQFYPNKAVGVVAQELLSHLNSADIPTDNHDLLLAFREIDQN